MAALHQPPRHIVIGIAAFFLVLCFVLFTPRSTHIDLHSTGRSASQSPLVKTSLRKADRFYGKDYKGHASPADINRVGNETLGFEKVFVVGLPERSDKRDAIALTSALTGFNVEWIDGVRGEAVPDKAVPFGADRKKLWETNLGSWRGHMNAVRRIIEEDLGSALIMEDDMDWDVRLKPQLERVAQGARALLSSASKPDSPYGNDWDLMWLGHCGEVFPETLDENKEKPTNDPGIRYMSRKFVIEKDATVPPKNRVTGLVDFKNSPEFTRWVHITGAPICTFAYALSQRGARKVLFDLSVDHLTGPFDNALAGLCRRAVSTWGVEDLSVAGDRGLDAKCISVTPPIFFHHKAKGLVNGDSDIQTVSDGQVREKGSTENIVWSARNNIKNMITGSRMESQFK
ncbi:glycosyltransferase family 25 protein [Hypoxylon trugodes]|uniref:glycosyltransferase family 25 protein n=1 Tax=Hypoxylon trugodes TaxID=326681 RepID=UPI002197633D|nr:glycosyltransferase family 25 protein [Hypoxylon trugodes]KAI1385301.1 glycosyltransferase family 25 protein [Hypoxylon trugodes]